jgi:hypothetical protein
MQDTERKIHEGYKDAVPSQRHLGVALFSMLNISAVLGCALESPDKLYST